VLGPAEDEDEDEGNKDVYRADEPLGDEEANIAE